jgi:hypothetical protein
MEAMESSMSDMNFMNSSPVPVKEPIAISNIKYVSSVRTTLCDIMCTVNASVNFNVPPPPDKLRPVMAVFPYAAQNGKTLKAKVRDPTLFQTLKLNENIQLLTVELKKDKEKYFQRLRDEKNSFDSLRNAKAVKIQALFRGYLKRRPTSYIRRRKRRIVHSQNDMQDELCTWAAGLGLKPIDGLSLETRSKTSRRKEKIMNAAAFRLHKFFDMILQRARARLRCAARREEIVEKCARVITRAVRYVKVRKFVKKCNTVKEQQSAVKIQCRARIFQAREK